MPVVYVALEGEAGFKMRVAAWKSRHQRKLPDGMHVVMQPFKLTVRIPANVTADSGDRDRSRCCAL